MTRLIKQFEGFRSKAYRCPAGVWTIGYGHTAGVTPGMTVSVEEAERLLREDLSPVLDSLPSGLNRNRTAALASLVFNIGIGAFRRS
ncbi:MAG: lysozyme, partial [Muribaculaceae bacterium]|nr:lysozyme [Muribaculaceae bacterium]